MRETGGIKPVLPTDVPKQVLEQNFFMRMEDMGSFLPETKEIMSKTLPPRRPKA